MSRLLVFCLISTNHYLIFHSFLLDLNNCKNPVTYHAVFNCSDKTLLPAVSEELDVSVHGAQSMSWVAGEGQILERSAAVQPQETHLHHISSWIVKLVRNNNNVMDYQYRLVRKNSNNDLKVKTIIKRMESTKRH